MAGTGSTASSAKPSTRMARAAAGSVINISPQTQKTITSTETLLELIDWNRLSPEAKAVARRIGPMLCEGYSVKEIARSLGRKDDWVSARIRILRDAIVAQVSEQLDGMEADLRAHIEKLVKVA